jgi:hypothetical protein
MSLIPAITQENFDSVLEPAAPGRPAKLTIQLRVALQPIDPQAIVDPQGSVTPTPLYLGDSDQHRRTGTVLDYNDRPFDCSSWLRTEWAAWKTRFKHAVELGWNNQMILLPTPSGQAGDELSDADYRQLMTGPGKRAFVQGAIEVQLMPDRGGNAHATIEVVHLADRSGRYFRPWMHRISDESVYHKSHGHSDWPGWQTAQITAAHEVGHWLKGLNATHFEHVDADYAKTLPRGPRRDRAQYGRTLGRKVALMGGGSLVTEHDAGPWLTRIRRHTTMKLGWSLMHRIHFNRDAEQRNLNERERRL